MTGATSRPIGSTPKSLATARLGPGARCGVALALMAELLVAAAATIAFAPPTFAVIVAIISRSTFGCSLGIKHISVIELFFVPSGFLIRLIGDAYAVQIYMSPWIIIATGMLALLRAIGKRRGDIAHANDSAHRWKSLAGYASWTPHWLRSSAARSWSISCSLYRNTPPIASATAC
jgi:hypothetical protein